MLLAMNAAAPPGIYPYDIYFRLKNTNTGPSVTPSALSIYRPSANAADSRCVCCAFHPCVRCWFCLFSGIVAVVVVALSFWLLLLLWFWYVVLCCVVLCCVDCCRWCCCGRCGFCVVVADILVVVVIVVSVLAV